MRKQRFINGVKKVLKRRYTSPEEITNIATEEAGKVPQLWERGTKTGSLQSKDTNSISNGVGSIVYGYDSLGYRDFEDVFSSGKRYNELESIQCVREMLQIYCTGKGSFYLADKAGHELSFPGKISARGRFMAHAFVTAGRIVSWHGDFAITTFSGDVSIVWQNVVKDVDETGNFTLTIERKSNQLRFKVKCEGDEGYASILVEWEEMRFNKDK